MTYLGRSSGAGRRDEAVSTASLISALWFSAGSHSPGKVVDSVALMRYSKWAHPVVGGRESICRCVPLNSLGRELEAYADDPG